MAWCKELAILRFNCFLLKETPPFLTGGDSCQDVGAAEAFQAFSPWWCAISTTVLMTIIKLIWSGLQMEHSTRSLAIFQSRNGWLEIRQHSNILNSYAAGWIWFSKTKLPKPVGKTFHTLAMLLKPYYRAFNQEETCQAKLDFFTLLCLNYVESSRKYFRLIRDHFNQTNQFWLASPCRKI